MMCLPGRFQICPAFATADGGAHEWYVPVDEEHYIYFQVAVIIKKNPLQFLLRNIKYYLWGKPVASVMFNNGDAAMVRQTTEYQKETPDNWVHMAKTSRNDDFHAAWRQYCDEWARGVGSKWLEQHRAQQELAMPARPA